MWILEFALTSLWMLGVAFGLTMGGWIHVVALAALALVFIENTSVERKLRSLFAGRPPLDAARRNCRPGIGTAVSRVQAMKRA